MRRLPTRPPDGRRVHRVTRRVLFADTDAAGVMYHARYLRYLEVGRVELFRDAGVSVRELHEAGWTVPVVDLAIEYHRPLRYDDPLVVASWVQDLRGASLVLGQRVDGPEGLSAVARVRVAYLDRSGRPGRLPEGLQRLVERGAAVGERG